MSYEETKEYIAELLFYYEQDPNSILNANRKMRSAFNRRLFQIRIREGGVVSYYILTKEIGGEKTVSRYDWDFFYGDFEN